MRRIWTAAVGLATVAGSLALAGAASAETNQVIAQTGGAEATFTLLGVPLKVGLELNTDTGDITAVNVTDEANQPAEMTATKVTPTKVRFASNTDGSTTVSVSAKKNAISFGVKTSDLGNLVGTNTWTADVFGTGSKSSVAYTIGNDGGVPTFELGTITPGSGIEANDLGSWNGSRRHDDDDDDGDTAGGRVEFLNDGFRKVLTIVVHVDHDDDHSHASLRVTLTGRNVQRKALADLAGDKTWTGLLCDGTTRATVKYVVGTDGTLTFTSATPDTAQAQSGEKGLTVRFATGDKVRIRLMTKDGGDAALAVNVSGKRCTDPAEKTPPTVNTPTSTPATTDGERKRDRDGGKRGGDDDRKRDGRDDD